MGILPFSVVIITKNEEANIGRAIRSVLPICNDVIVVDSGSLDRTKTIALELGAKVIEQEWLGYSKTKNVGSAHALYPYIFSLDADEAFSFGLIQSLVEVFSGDSLLPVYKLNRLNHFAGKAIKHGAWYPDWQYRLFNKNVHQWQESDEVHENLNWNEQTVVGILKGDLLHFTTESEAYYLEKMKKYAQLFYSKRVAQGKAASPLKAYSSAGFRFFKEYILQAGFLDGSEGFRIARAHFAYTRGKYMQ
jgi:(heptosyl)LPS beta-1,4-glucosyltransferase